MAQILKCTVNFICLGVDWKRLYQKRLLRRVVRFSCIPCSQLEYEDTCMCIVSCKYYIFVKMLLVDNISCNGTLYFVIACHNHVLEMSIMLGMCFINCRIMKKQPKPEVFLDNYLTSIGLWRKPLPRDGLSLFRAVSEQVLIVNYKNS